MMRRRTNESGFALILTLVVTALMVAVVVEMIHQVYVDTSISRGFRDGQQASILAESGVMAVKAALAQKSIDPALLSAILAKPLSDEVGSLEIAISDESGKININGLVNGQNQYNAPVSSALLRLPVTPAQRGDTWSTVVASVADWLDTDEGANTGGAETPYYRALKPPYKAHNGKLMTLTELTLVKGFTPALLDGLVGKNEKLKDCLTIYPREQSQTATINVNAAPKAVLMALDPSITESVADQILQKRPFKDVGEFSKVPELNNLLKGAWTGRLTAPKTFTLYKITAVATVKESVRKIEAVVSGNIFLSWQEY